MNNPQSKAIVIEHFLTSKNYADLGDADAIRKDPIAFMDSVLKKYERISEENDKRSADFWDKYEQFKGKRLDEFDDDTVNQLILDIKCLFN